MSKEEITIILDETDIERITKYLNEGTEDIDDILMEICSQTRGVTSHPEEVPDV